MPEFEFKAGDKVYVERHSYTDDCTIWVPATIDQVDETDTVVPYRVRLDSDSDTYWAIPQMVKAHVTGKFKVGDDVRVGDRYLPGTVTYGPLENALTNVECRYIVRVKNNSMMYEMMCWEHNLRPGYDPVEVGEILTGTESGCTYTTVHVDEDGDAYTIYTANTGRKYARVVTKEDLDSGAFIRGVL